MANGGWYGTQEEWARLEAPLLGVDPIVARFALDHGLGLSKNHKDWPERSIRWGLDPICLIQLFLADEHRLTWNLWIAAFQDRNSGRYWKRALLVESKPMDAFVGKLPALLEEARETLLLWSQRPEEFEFAVSLDLPR